MIVRGSSLDDGCMIIHGSSLFICGSSLDNGCLIIRGSSLWFIIVHDSFMRSRIFAGLIVCGSSLFAITRCEILDFCRSQLVTGCVSCGRWHWWLG